MINFLWNPLPHPQVYTSHQWENIHHRPSCIYSPSVTESQTLSETNSSRSFLKGVLTLCHLFHHKHHASESQIAVLPLFFLPLYLLWLTALNSQPGRSDSWRNKIKNPSSSLHETFNWSLHSLVSRKKERMSNGFETRGRLKGLASSYWITFWSIITFTHWFQIRVLTNCSLHVFLFPTPMTRWEEQGAETNEFDSHVQWE